MKKFGLIGYPLTHSFSKKYYDAKMEREHISGIDYQLYALPNIEAFAELLKNEPLLAGVNVTIPYKVAVLPFVDHLSPEAAAIGAVNCIRIERLADKAPVLTGYNTDVFGFLESLKPLLRPRQRRALVLGSGGAAKAVMYALGLLGVDYTVVSRNASPGQLSYEQVDAPVLADHRVIINTTPLGTYPAVDSCPPLPYTHLGTQHLLYDLVYNPPETEFLRRGQAQGAATKNGLEMLELQAERNWEIWTNGS